MRCGYAGTRLSTDWKEGCSSTGQPLRQNWQAQELESEIIIIIYIILIVHVRFWFLSHERIEINLQDRSLYDIDNGTCK